MKLDKYKLIEELETEIRSQIDQVKTCFENASETELQSPSASGGWSIVQCLDHLNSYGLYYLPQISDALKKAERSETSIYHSGWLGDYFTKIMSPETGTKKFKAFKDHQPKGMLDSKRVISEFLRQEELLLVYLGDAKHIDMASVKVPVSISRWIGIRLGDTFRFLLAHNKRHLLQALRILNIEF
ncbi:MAG: DinB family protein [Daejeonella sp.]|uniref:DinB family protein n=1 Tax=Daejeonella sp. TaxID=2805397 RepID=UPI002733D2DC|nr:DinB family protein [Daejeonella sp.]MDP3468638.1 DinB family protein [Daejeonella sp.]